MEFKFNSHEYERFIDLINKVTGTVESSYRYFQIYYRRGLKFFATDGCAKVEFSSPIEASPFSGVYTIPIDYARTLKSGKGEALNFSLEDDRVRIDTGFETLTLENSKVDEVPVMERKFEFSARYNLREFTDNLNFVSAASMEGDTIEIYSKGGTTYLAAAAGNLALIASLECEPRHEFALSIPYVTVRHLVKAFEQLKVEQIDAGIGITDLGLKAGPLLFSTCTDETTLVPPHTLVGTRTRANLSRKTLLAALRKITRLSRRGFSVLFISKNSSLKFYLKAANLRYECDVSTFEGEEFILQIDPHKFHSAVSRMKAANLNLSVESNKLLVSGQNSEQHLLISLIR